MSLKPALALPLSLLADLAGGVAGLVAWSVARHPVPAVVFCHDEAGAVARRNRIARR